jgi:hypothetical protein
MNKVTKDLMKWFPILGEGNALNVYSQLMIEGIDFSSISNKELKAEAKRVIIEMYGDE